MTRVCALAGVVLFAIPAMGASPGLPPLAFHRAIYEVSLAHTAGGIVAAHGRMAIEFRDTCDGWSTTQRFIADMTDSQGVASRTDFFVSAWESKDGRTMRFDVSDTRNGKSQERQRGSATLGADGSGRVELLRGKPASFALPKGTQFPTSQMLAILGAAQSGRRSYKHLVFSGGGQSDLNFSTAVIGKFVAPSALSSEHAVDAGGVIRGVAAWSALISAYPVSTHAETPDYEVAAHLFANGVNGSMSLIYPDYMLKAKLVRLEPLKASC
jgi:hypothetical protein